MEEKGTKGTEYTSHWIWTDKDITAGGTEERDLVTSCECRDKQVNSRCSGTKRPRSLKDCEENTPRVVVNDQVEGNLAKRILNDTRNH